MPLLRKNVRRALRFGRPSLHIAAMEMTLSTTAIILAVTATLTVFCGYMGQRPMNPLKGPTLIPWRFLMLLFFTGSLMLVVHLVNLVGFDTGQNQRY